jgi:hypothetical protein
MLQSLELVDVRMQPELDLISNLFNADKIVFIHLNVMSASRFLCIYSIKASVRNKILCGVYLWKITDNVI